MKEIIQETRNLVSLYYGNCMQCYSEVPDDMLKNERDPYGLTEWKLIPSKVEIKDIDSLEEQLPFKLPIYFKSYLLSYCVIGMDLNGGYSLPDIPSNNPLSRVKQDLFWEEQYENLWSFGLAPFAHNDLGDPVCFDFQNPTELQDYKIYTINHYALSDSKTRESILENSLLICDSFKQFLTEICQNLGKKLNQQ